MEAKFNQATPQRPDGTRPVDAPLLVADLPALVAQLRRESPWRNSHRNAITVFKTDGLRIVLVALHAGTVMQKHTTGITSIHVLEGQLTLSTEHQSVEVGPGHLLALHAGIPHRIRAITESVFLLTLAMRKYVHRPR